MPRVSMIGGMRKSTLPHRMQLLEAGHAQQRGQVGLPRGRPGERAGLGLEGPGVEGLGLEGLGLRHGPEHARSLPESVNWT